MKELLFKNTTITFIIINVWTFILFFNYLLEEPGMFRGLETFGLYLYSIIFGIFIGVITILLRVFLFKKNKSKKLKSNFIYLFAGVFNLTLFVTWITLVILKILYTVQSEILYLIICNTIISLIILSDLFILKTIDNSKTNM